MKNTTETVTENQATIKLGIDAHAKWYYVARRPGSVAGAEDA